MESVGCSLSLSLSHILNNVLLILIFLVGPLSVINLVAKEMGDGREVQLAWEPDPASTQDRYKVISIFYCIAPSVIIRVLQSKGMFYEK